MNFVTGESQAILKRNVTVNDLESEAIREQ